MKKVLLYFVVFFWLMFFPELSLNSFTTEIEDENISYSVKTTGGGPGGFETNGKYDIFAGKILITL